MAQAVLRRGSRVLDLSQHNGSVDFQKVRAAGIDGVIVRAAYIGPGNVQTRDSMFTAQRVKEIRAAGLVMGAYIYSVPIKGGRHGWDDFQFLYKVLHDVSRGLRGGIDMKLVADLEESELDGKGNSRWLLEFDAESRHHGFGTIGYAAISAIPFADKVNVPCWVGNPGAAPGHPNGLPGFASSVAIHQFTFTARVNGVSGDVDESVVVDPSHLILPAGAKPKPGPPAPRPTPKPKAKRTAADVQQAMWIFLHNRGYKVSTDGGGGLAVDNVWGRQSSLAKLECQSRLGYPRALLGSKVDDRFMNALAHPARFLNPLIRPGYCSRAAARKVGHVYFDKLMPFKGGLGKWDGMTASEFIVISNTRVEKMTGVHANVSDPKYGLVRTDAMQATLRADYVNSGYNPAYIAAPVGRSRHQKWGRWVGAEDLSNPSDFDAACRRSSTRPPYRYNYDGSGDIVHISDNAA
jgi:hypothetical protein